MTYRDGDIAVIGMALRVPGAQTPDDFWSLLLTGGSGLQRLSDAQLSASNVPQHKYQSPHYVPVAGIIPDVEDFDANYFGLSQRESEEMDPQGRILMECVDEALQRSGYNPRATPSIIGLFAGQGHSRYHLKAYLEALKLNPELPPPAYLDSVDTFLTTKIAYRLNLRGPAVTVQSACSTSLVAIHQACNALLLGDCEIAVAGGVSIMYPQEVGYVYHPEGILSSDGHCRAFDASAQGTVIGHGGGVVVLKRASDAYRDNDPLIAIVKGTAINNDGNSKVGYFAPSVEGQVRLIRSALENADVTSEEVSFIEGHGTGTLLGDPIELEAIRRAFDSRDRETCYVGSVKANIGHLDAAAGIASFIKAVLTIKNGIIPPQPDFETLNPKVVWDQKTFVIPKVQLPWNTVKKTAVVNSFGIGGTNVSVVLSEVQENSHTSSKFGTVILPISANSFSALRDYIAKVTKFLKENEVNLGNFCNTWIASKPNFPFRQSFEADNQQDLLAKLDRFLSRENALQSSFNSNGAQCSFLFPGQASQYLGMGKEYYNEDFPQFVETFDLLDQVFRSSHGRSMAQVLWDSDASVELGKTLYAQPCLFAIEFALAEQLKYWGMDPTIVAGHSLGEITAAATAGIFRPEDAMRFLLKRGEIMQATATGKMVVVHGTEEQIAELGLLEDLDIAARNSPKQIVLAGVSEAVQRAITVLKDHGIRHDLLPGDRAFHSRLVDGIEVELRDALSTIQLHPPQIAMISSVTGKLLSTTEVLDSEYWVDQARNPVAFAQVVQTLNEKHGDFIVQVGPGRALLHMTQGQQERGLQSAQLIDTMMPGRTGSQALPLISALGRWWEQGGLVKWETYLKTKSFEKIEVPTYPYQRKTYSLFKTDQHKTPAAISHGLPNDSHRPNDTTGQSVAASVPPSIADILSIWQNALGNPSLTVSDDFFEFGGDSLTAHEVAIETSRLFDTQLAISDIYSYPSVQKFFDHVSKLLLIEERTESDENLFDQDSELADQILPSTMDKPLNWVLLTGVTGFVGIYLLRSIIRRTSDGLICLIRADNLQKAKKRLLERLKYYRIEISDDDWGRIQIILGNIQFDHFGLGEDAYNLLSWQVSRIYHAAAVVNFSYPYQALRSANVEGVVRILQFASVGCKKEIHHVSTMEVFALKGSGKSAVDESSTLFLPNNLPTGYAKSKAVAEEILRHAQRNGHQVAIYRPGVVSAALDSGADNFAGVLATVLRTCYRVGAAIDFSMTVSMIPVDFVADSIVLLSRQDNALSNTFHLEYPTGTPFVDLFRRLDKLIPMRWLVPTDWVDLLRSRVVEEPALLTVLSLFEETLLTDDFINSLETDSSRTLEQLDGLGLKLPPIDDSYIDRFLNFMISTDQLKLQ